MATKRIHPSVKFQHGDVKDFATAMEVYVEQYREELLISREIIREYGSGDKSKDYSQINEQAQAVAEIALQVEIAKNIYETVVGAAIKQAATQMREQGNMHLNAIADALESGDWSLLAV